jgi:RHS repeat-associated protein
MNSPESTRSTASNDERFSAPAASLPKGGGAIKGMGEKFAASPVTGTGSLTIPLPLSPGRSGFTPALALSYDSGSGNGPYGFGWSVGYPSITRRTDRGIPQYLDKQESDVYILSGAEDLVPVLNADGSPLARQRSGYEVTRYRPRIEGLFARIERWANVLDLSDVFWRSISRDNITTFYGKTADSRIADPADPTRIFSWLLTESFDDKGNAAIYEYLAEDGRNVTTDLASEFNRREQDRTANRYLKRVKYANRVSRLKESDLSRAEWLFELVMDYGDHEGATPSVDPSTNWQVRPDPFSNYRAGFEVRTYRRCRRFLMFHRFDELGPEPKLVRSLELDYHDFDYTQDFETRNELQHAGSTRIGSFIHSATVTGYAESGLRKSLPPLQLTYSRPQITEEARILDETSSENIPGGVDGNRYHWLDLNSEGLSGILTEQGSAWWYKPNLGDGRFGPQQLVPQKPSIGLETRAQFLDLAGDGALDLVQLHQPNAGFFERDDKDSWSEFTPFLSQPNIEWDDPNLRFVDLTGDGHVDVLITEDDVICWHPSLAEAGFGPRESLKMAVDESLGPKLVFHDTTETIFLADMSGDGLSDLVQIRNGEICYWPNLGYGRFGGKVTMDDAPILDSPELFEPRRIRLADIDGSGAIDILYLARDGFRLYFNRSGNSWSAPYELANFPAVDNVASINVVDLLGNGTACLVWSSPLPNEVRTPLHYVDLMAKGKPHLLVGVENNLGARTRVQYTSSTRFYLEDQLAGRSWITRLPFPVHVVERTETFDDISRNRFVTRYAYHHGYFDGVEREFRGFGMVEQFDTEEFAALNPDQELSPTNIDASSHVPPVLTRTWFHTGVHVGRDRISNFFAGLLDENYKGEYYREPGLTDAEVKQFLLDDTVLPIGLTIEEEREARRALKGAMLRQEVYALDGTTKQPHPYSVTEQNFNVRLLQPKGANPHAVFFTHPLESISYHYERNPADPRIAHSLTLEVDEFGNVLKSAAVGYGRREKIRLIDVEGNTTRIPNPELNRLEERDQEKQTLTLITYTENAVTNRVETEDEYRAPLPSESLSYELTGLVPNSERDRFTLQELRIAGVGAEEIAYELSPTSELPRKRLIEHVRTLYRRNDLSGPLPPRELESLALPFETYKLAFTRGLIGNVYGPKVTDSMLVDDGHYVQTENPDRWWISSGRVFYSGGKNDGSAAELVNARQHFFLSRRYQDPFAQSTSVAYDNYDLLVLETEDALANRITCGERDDTLPVDDPNRIKSENDYRVLEPRLITDPNGNRAAVSFDAMGMVAGTAVRGKTNETLGDSLTAFVADLTPQQIDDFLGAKDPHDVAAALLGNASSRIVYDLDRFLQSREANPDDQGEWVPPFAATIARETHVSDLEPDQPSKLQISFSYSDGFGREIQKKIQAEAGRVPRRDADRKIIVGADGQPEMTTTSFSPRWVGSGWTIFNNKGKPVRQFEPYFTDTHHFEFDVRIGVSSVLFYDPAERAVATLHPNHTWEKVIFDPWRPESWDVNDTALITDPKVDADVGSFFKRLADEEYLPTWHTQRVAGALGTTEQAAATKTAMHAETPSIAHADSLGRTFLTVSHNRFKTKDTPDAVPPTNEFYSTRVIFDIEGNQREVIDAKDRVVMHYDYDMLGNPIHQSSMEAGERWMVNNVAGQPIRAFDTRGHQFKTEYDQLRRPLHQIARGTDAINSDPRLLNRDVLIGKTEYGEGQTGASALNLRTRVFRTFDSAGVVTSMAHDPVTNRNQAYDFKGNLLRSSRQLVRDYEAVPDWSQQPELEVKIFNASTTFDALNRPVSVTAPDDSVYRPTFNDANLLERVDVNLRGAETATSFVSNIHCDAKGQRVFIEYANNTRTEYEYDRETFRAIHLKTTRSQNLNGISSQLFKDPTVVQDLRYIYDPAGNITRIQDDAALTVFNNNKQVESSSDYTYDAIYRLIAATGREHIGQSSFQFNPSDGNYRDYPFIGAAQLNDLQAVRNYDELYEYDPVGNFERMIHQAANGRWTRSYFYNEPSLIEPSTKQSNRLSSTTVGGNAAEVYNYDAHGNMTAMQHLSLMQWDFKDQLQASSRQVRNDGTPGKTFYVYDAAGQRVRKVTEDQNGNRKNERIYLGGFEVYREYEGNGTSVKLERETLHVMDDKQRIALVETRTQGNDGSPSEVIRYQFGDHLGSASLELDDVGQIISYEEYYPYGSTSFQAGRSAAEVSLKRFRYTGMERDKESGLCYHGARYYASWLGLWVSIDPDLRAFLRWSPFSYALDSPVRFLDVTGRGPEDPPGLDKLFGGVDRLFKKAQEYEANVEQYYADARERSYDPDYVKSWEGSSRERGREIRGTIHDSVHDLTSIKAAVEDSTLRGKISDAIRRLNAIEHEVEKVQQSLGRLIPAVPPPAPEPIIGGRGLKPPPVSDREFRAIHNAAIARNAKTTNLPTATARYVAKPPKQLSAGGAGGGVAGGGSGGPIVGGRLGAGPKPKLATAVEDAVIWESRLLKYGLAGGKAYRWAGRFATYVYVAVSVYEVGSDLWHEDYRGAAIDSGFAVADFFTFGGASLLKDSAEGIGELYMKDPAIHAYVNKGVRKLQGIDCFNASMNEAHKWGTVRPQGRR